MGLLLHLISHSTHQHLYMGFWQGFKTQWIKKDYSKSSDGFHGFYIFNNKGKFLKTIKIKKIII